MLSASMSGDSSAKAISRGGPALYPRVRSTSICASLAPRRLLAELVAVRPNVTVVGVQPEEKYETSKRFGRPRDVGDAIAMSILMPSPPGPTEVRWGMG